MPEYSILIGGKAGDGIRQAGLTIGRLLSRLGYHIFVYDDYPSVIRGSHNFAIVRASDRRIRSHKREVDVIVALDAQTYYKHSWRLTGRGTVIYDEDELSGIEGISLPLKRKAMELKYPSLTRNSMAIGALAGAMGISFENLESVIRDSFRRYQEENARMASIGYEEGSKNKIMSVEKLEREPFPLLSGNEALSLGAVKAGLKLYIAYPMTPASPILHFLAAMSEELGVVTVHPENEIAVATMAIGAAFAGVRAMVGTSGGGFALMNEALSLVGQSEVPMVFVNAMRPGPSTGVPTYTAQGDLLWAIYAGHGEFPKVVLAPGDVEEAFYLAGKALNIAWRFQVPVILLTDKHLGESSNTTEIDEGRIRPEKPKLWDGKGEYRRYLITEDGISPLAFPGTEGAVVKGTSYEHGERGITTEEPDKIATMNEKRFRKLSAILDYMKREETVKVYGGGDTTVVTWGSTKGAVLEAAEELGLRVVQPLFLEPFPTWAVKGALEGVSMVIDVEANYTGQLATLLRREGIEVHHRVLKYDGRPFTPDEMVERLREVL